MTAPAATPLIIAVLYPADGNTLTTPEVVDYTTLPGYGLDGQPDAQWTVNTSNDPGRIENLVKGDVLTQPAPNGLATYLNGQLVQQIGAYAATPEWPQIALGSTIAEPSTATPVFPHDPSAAHALDALAVDQVVTKTSQTTVNVSPAVTAGMQATPIEPGDVLQHLPVGSTIQLVGDQLAVTLPATATSPKVTGTGSSIHQAIANLWHFLVARGDAVIADLKKL